MVEHRARVKKGVEVEYVIVRGRRPHGCLHSMTPGYCRAGSPRGDSPTGGRLGGLALDLGDLDGRGTVDRDAARLHGLGNFALQLDEEESVLEASTLDLDMVRKGELALEVSGRDTAM